MRDLVHAEIAAKRFHKAATVLASHAMGIALDELVSNEYALPVVVRDAGVIYVFNLGKESTKDNDFIAPYVVNAAFSLELHLKVLCFLERRILTKVHHLSDLYSELSADSRAYINKKVEESRADGITPFVLAELAERGISLDWTAQTLLQRSSQAFIAWRYAFDTEAGCFAGYSELQSALEQRITDIKSN